MLTGVILSLAASPPVATRIGLDPFHFFTRHVMFLLPAFIVLVGVSFLSPKQIRRTALIVFAVSIALIVATLLFGAEVKGSKRWITLVGVNIQASESAKPAFVVVAAWLFAESTRRPEMPATSMALAMLLLLVGLLVMEPDFGQTMLILMVWGALFFIAGMRMIWVLGLAGAAGAGLFSAYLFVPHVAGRIKRFLNPASGDTFQVDTAMEAFFNGGWFGLGPGEGIAKRSLPDSHTDFVFAVAAEEFGIILCLMLLALYAFIVIRSLSRAYASEDMFARFAASGLAILFGVQGAINMAVNLQLIPAKGMTLPFISYGGSSIISLAYGVGMMLALTRLRPSIEVESSNEAGALRSYA
jgi:cell division protein FtsW